MTYLIKPDACTAWRYVMWLITCLLRVCSALYCELSAGLSCQAVSSGVAGCSCLPDGPSSTPPSLHLHEVCLVRAASWHHASKMQISDGQVQFSLVLSYICWTMNWTLSSVQRFTWTPNWTYGSGSIQFKWVQGVVEPELNLSNLNPKNTHNFLVVHLKS